MNYMQPTDSWAQDWFQEDLGIELTSTIKKKTLKNEKSNWMKQKWVNIYLWL